jgi:hypothetical protein
MRKIKKGKLTYRYPVSGAVINLIKFLQTVSQNEYTKVMQLGEYNISTLF